MFVKQCSIHGSRAKYIWEKKTNKLQVHLKGWTCSLFVFFLPYIYIHIYIYIYIYMNFQGHEAQKAMRPRRPKQYCLQLVIYIYIYLTIIRRRQGEYCRIIPETKSRGLFDNIHRAWAEQQRITDYHIKTATQVFVCCRITFIRSFTSKLTSILNQFTHRVRQ